jgi:OOP family OmpA-OmpF porin
VTVAATVYYQRRNEMSKRNRFFIFIVFVLFLTTGVEAGEKTAGTFSLTPMIGGYVFDGRQDLDNAPVYSIGFGYNYTETLSVESVLQYIDTESDRTEDDVDGYIFRFDGLYHFMTEERLVPYAAAGLGLISINGDARDGNTAGLFNYGGGVKYFLNKSLALRGDVRHLLDFDGTNSNLSYMFGITYLFGERGEKVPRSPMDSDDDGVYDDADSCPGTPRGVQVDDKGCPKDSDGDGVYDYLDKCPDTPSGAPVDSAGCPLDSDGDGVYDYLDQCPDTPAGIKVDPSGCPIPIKEKVSIQLNVEFEFNSAHVRSMYDSQIQKVADFLAAYPNTIAVIEGHTDSKGSEAYNLKLSQRRAESVVRILIDHGINASRLKAIGYGESRPVADNNTEEGRQRNRRVVAVITTVVSK